MSRSWACAQSVVAQLVACGVTDLVIAPGSRSAPLALAAAACDGLRLHVRVDERTAGFLALGLAKGAGRCAAVLTTSGTAVGNLLPAVMEASHARVPLLVLSADRPSDQLGTGANQTTWQAGIFGVFTRHATVVDAAADPAGWAASVAAAVAGAEGRLSGHPGPAHVNLAFPEPLVPLADPDRSEVQPAVPAEQPAATTPAVTTLPPGPRTVVACGDATAAEGEAARRFAEAAALPLLAEPSSQARTGPNALRCGRLLLGTELGERVERVVLFGHPTLSRPVNRLLTRPDVELVVVGQGPDLPDPGHNTALVAAAVTLEPQPTDWLDRWRTADAACGARVDALLGGLDRVSGPALAATVLAAAHEGSVALGNSMAIRDADLAPITERPVPVHANRGLSGIDGTLSTAAGIALATGAPVTLLCGDLSFVHDANALAIGPGEPRPPLRVVVADDAGGAIFATLEYGEDRFAGAFERLFATPTGVDPVALATAMGVPARRVRGLAELSGELSRPITGPEVLVIGVDRSGRRDLSRRLAECAVPR